MSRAVATRVVRARVDQLAQRVRWFDSSGKPLPHPHAEDALDDDGSKIKDAIVRWLEQTSKQD